MTRGGKRKGTGRPKASSESKEPTKTVRVPIGFAEKIPELLKQYQEENSFDDLQLPSKRDENLLPLASLAWDAFESFSLDFIARFLKPKDIYHYGTQGDDQEGVDIVADLHNGEKWAFQCKQWQKFNKGDAIKVIQQAQGFEANRLILLLSRVASVEVRKVIADDLRWEVWDVRDISQKVQEIEIESARRLVRGHFHPEWQNAFLKISKLTPFISYEDFFHGWLNENRLFNHTWKLEGRNEELKSLHGFVSLQDKQVAILSGRGGIGKTRLLYEFAKTFEHSNFLLWFVEEGQSVTPENVDNLSLYPSIIVLDDAHKLERERDLQTLLAIIRERSRANQPEIKLVLSSRPHAVDHLKLILRQGGISSSQIEIVNELKELKVADSKALARQVLGHDYGHFAELLATVTKDCPLVTVVGGRLLATKGLPLYLLERDEEFYDEVLNQLKNDSFKSIIGIESKISEKLLNLISAVSPIHLMEEQFQQAASEFLNIDKSELLSYIGTLENGGILLRRGDGLRITPDVLSDHILHKACLTDQGEPTGYAVKIFNSFREIYPSPILRNLAELDWRVSLSKQQETNLLSTILQDLREEFKKAPTNLDRCKMLDLLKEIAYYQPKYSLNIVEFIIRNPLVTEKRGTYDFTHSNVIKELPEIIERIGNNLEYVPQCCELLWQIGRNDQSKTYNNPPESIRSLVNFAKYEIDKPYDFNWQVLKTVEKWLQESDIHDHIYSPLDILDPLLDKEIEHRLYDGISLKISTFSVIREETQEIRQNVLEVIQNLLNSSNLKVVLRALKSLSKALQELENRSSEPLEEVNQLWESEQLEILEMINSLVISDNIEPFVCLNSIEYLDWYSRHSSSEAVKLKARDIIDSVPKTDDLKLTGVLSSNYLWDWQEGEIHYDWNRKEQIDTDIAKTFLERYPFPQNGIQALNERMQIISANGGKISPLFLEMLPRLNPNYSIEICEQLLKLEDCPLSLHMASILYQAKDSDIQRSIKVVKNAVNSDRLSFCASFAKKYWAWDKDFTQEDLTEITQTLLTHPDFEVRKLAISSLAMLIQSQPKSTLSLVLNIEISGHEELAEELFGAISRVSLDDLTYDELKILLDKLELTRTLDKYHISKFLVHACKKVPLLSLQLMLKRIKLSINKNDYDPIPSDCFENYLHHLSESEDYEVILREIIGLWFEQRELSDSSSNNSIVSSIKLNPLYKKLYREASFTFIGDSQRVISPVSLRVISEWVKSKDSEKIKASSELINLFHSGFIFGHSEFVKNLLEKSYDAGDQCYEVVSRNLFAIAYTKTRMGISGQPFPEDIQLRDQASEIAKQCFKGSPIYKFYSSLAAYAESEIKRQVDLYKDVID